MIVATAGHVDHGKTLLVKKLTGMDTDRLEEEKRRGLSINLGFAYLKSAGNKTIAFVDVPGHMRFINNMIAGINGIDLGMLVVAADDGPMPQTREHLDVLKLLGVRRFVLVISKIDRVDYTRIEEVRKKAMVLFSESDEVPVFEVNSPSEEGITGLIDHLEQEANKLAKKPVSGYFRLSIDRAFLIKGKGLIVTGTVASGSVQPGDTLMLLPQDVPVRVRTLQVQEQEAEQAVCGQRCALNISGDIEKEDIERGDWLVGGGINQTTTRFDARAHLLQHAPFPFKHMAPVKLYIGAKRLSASLALLKDRTMQAGQSAFVQLIVKNPIHCCHGDRFLLRDDSESETLGGGVVLDSSASAARRSSAARLQILAAMELGTAQDALRSLLFEQKQMVNLSQFCLGWNIRADEESVFLDIGSYGDKLTLLEYDGQSYAVSSEQWQSVSLWIQRELAKKHNQNSGGRNTGGMWRGKFLTNFKSEFPGFAPEIVIGFMQTAGIITAGQDTIALREQAPELSGEQEAMWAAINSYLIKSHLQVPVVGDMAHNLSYEKLSVQALCKIATRQKWLVAVAENRFVLRQHAEQFARVALSLANKQKFFSVADFKNACGIGRNLAVEVLEYFDKIGFTLRKESGRVILHKDRIITMIARSEKN